ncbi:MAG: DUF4149 domain-containing protein [Acidobacteriota bacterium]|nr:DUF4149 domain-containing protein [Acidobacteriota bacterium]
MNVETVLRALRLLGMVLWVGGLCFFAFVVAPVAFGSLNNTHDAGLVVGGCLRVLHWMGLVTGALFYLTTAILWLRAPVDSRVSFALQLVLTGIMLAITCYSQFHIIPRMEVDRLAAGGSIGTAAVDSPARVDFERLHMLSERLEGLVLLGGLGVVLLLARESQWTEPGKSKAL